MLNFFTKILFFIFLCEQISFAQDIENYEISDYNRLNMQNYDYTHPLDYDNEINDFVDKKNEKKYTILYDDKKNDYPSSIAKSKNNKKTNNDGMGTGFRVYDNSNRQSYFCGLNQAIKPKFSHDNNFNGVYFGVAINSISSSVDFSLKSSNVFSGSNKYTPPPNISQNFSGTSSLPSIILGQGRLFSNGLFLGQEASINVGEFSATKKNFLVDNVNLNEVKMFSSNFSTYSGKFGYNIFRNFLPYAKVSISLSPIKYLIKVDDNADVERYRYLTVGEMPSFGFGAGMDISLYDHVRMMMDYTTFSNSSEFNGGICLKLNCSDSYVRKAQMNTNFSVAKVGIVWRF